MGSTGLLLYGKTRRRRPHDDDHGCAVPQEFNPDGSLVTAVGATFDFGTSGKQNNCVGLQADDMILPVACGDNDNFESILSMLKPTSEGGIKNNGGTSNALSLDQIANLIANGYMGPSRPAGQKNIIIYLSDGAEDCACEKNLVELPVGDPGHVPAPDEDIATLRVDPNPDTTVTEDKAPTVAITVLGPRTTRASWRGMRSPGSTPDSTVPKGTSSSGSFSTTV